MFSYTF